MRDHTVALHLPKAQPPVPRPPLHGLPVEHLRGPPRARMDLVIHHVLQALVVRGPEKNESIQGLARVAIIQTLVAMPLVPAGVQHVRHVLDVDLVEGRSIALISREAPNLPQDRLDQVTDCHARGDSVGVHDEIGGDALCRERHVIHPIRHTNSPLLPVSRRKLVSDLRDPYSPHLDLHEALPCLVVRRHEHLVDGAVLVVAQARACVALGGLWSLIVLVSLLHERRLSDDNVSIPHILTRRRKSVGIELLVVDPLSSRPKLLPLRPLEGLHAQRPLRLGLVGVAPIEHAAEEPAVDAALAHDQRVLLVVS
mmetsp:Transcript_21954/g.54083  ORF Transcript_21954/g.54083 Transcript_21954/m.54083 type:complete len:311 (+) Transcript_21954:323-1255(+)